MHKALVKAIKEKYFFRPYSKNYLKFFAQEKSTLLDVLKAIPKKKVFHIGSTSVSGLGGKRVIDIIALVPKGIFSTAREFVEDAGYKYDSSLHGRSLFLKYAMVKGKPRLIHLHLTYSKKELIKALAFRDYLRSHKKARKEYEAIKQKASRCCGGNGLKYKAAKLRFVEETLKKALREYAGKE